MRRLALLLSVFVVLVGWLAHVRDDVATAQEAMPSHPVVGMWRVTNELGEGNVFPSLAMFHADGTYIEDYPDAMSYSMGLWEPTGERTAAVTVYQVYVIDDRLVNAEGRWSVEVNEAGDALRTAGLFVGTFEDGSIDIAVEWADEEFTATRLGVLPVVPLADLVPGGTPVIPVDVTGEATPTP